MTAKKGFAAISIVLTLLVVSVVFSVMIFFLSIGEAQSSLTLYRGEQALALVESCGEEALLQFRNDEGFSEEAIVLPDGECSLEFSGDADERTIAITAEKDGFTRSIEIRARRTVSGLELLSWLE